MKFTTALAAAAAFAVVVVSKSVQKGWKSRIGPLGSDLCRYLRLKSPFWPIITAFRHIYDLIQASL